MRLVFILAVIWPGVAMAWERLDTQAINTALADRSLRFDAYSLQRFHSSGKTEYITERYSEGRWSAREDQYCSTWPPSDLWTCYDVDRQGNQIRFVSGTGSISVGTYLE